MADRRELQAEKNRIVTQHNTQKVKMEKAGASIEQLSRLNKLKNDRISQLEEQYGDDLNKLNKGKTVTVSGGTLSGTEIDQTGLPDMAKQKGLGKEGIFKKLGKKVAGVIPLAGTAYGFASGDPAMAAEEAAGDIPVLGQAYEAIKPEMAGNPEEERMMLAEDKARKAYSQSPAAVDAKEAALKKLRGY